MPLLSTYVDEFAKIRVLVVGSYNFYDDVQERNPIWVNSLTRKTYKKNQGLLFGEYWGLRQRSTGN